MKNIFRYLLIVSTVFYILWFFLPFFWDQIYSVETLTALEWNGFGAILSSEGPIPYVIFLAYLFSIYGLLLYKAWARSLFLYLTIFSILSSPLWGLNVQGPYDLVLGSVITYSDGIILTLAYFSSVGEEFKNKNS